MIGVIEMRLILASNSTIRKAIFDMIGWKYEVITSNIADNSSATSHEQYVIDLSKEKANSVASQINDKALIIAADTIIYMFSFSNRYNRRCFR